MPRRVIKASSDALAAVEVGEQFARMNGNNENFFYADESGCYISGPISIRADPSDVRIGTGYTFQPAYKAQIPSTISSPQPTIVANSPVEGFSRFAEEVAELLGDLL
jgi:hypothetical protein